MKTKRIKMVTLALLPVVMLALDSCSSTPEPPPRVGSGWFTPNKDAAGGVRVQTIQVAGTVTAMDKAKRTATILEPDGISFMVTVKPEAVNFDAVNVGDQINATVVERIVESLAEEGSASAAGATATGQRLPHDTTLVRGEITTIDSADHTGTIEFENGQTETIKIQGDYHYQVGQKIEFRIVERNAIWIEKQAQP